MTYDIRRIGRVLVLTALVSWLTGCDTSPAPAGPASLIEGEAVTAPTWPAEAALGSRSTGPHYVHLEWPDAIAQPGIAGYDISVGDTTTRVRATSSVVAPLEPGRTYEVSVRAVDDAGRASEPLTWTCETGLSWPEQQPSVPGLPEW